MYGSPQGEQLADVWLQPGKTTQVKGAGVFLTWTRLGTKLEILHDVSRTQTPPAPPSLGFKGYLTLS